MRILHFIPNLLSGGAQQQLAYLAAEQKRRHEDVHVAYVHEGPKRTAFDRSGATLHVLSASGNHDPMLFAKVLTLVRRLKPDVVQTWLIQMDILGGIAAIMTGTSWVLSERSSAGMYPAGIKVMVRERLGRHADAIVANSPEGNDYWASRVSARVVRRLVRNGLPTEMNRNDVPNTGHGFPLPVEEKTVLYVGRLSPEKNIETLIRALEIVTKRMPAVAFLCGDGTHDKEAQALIQHLGAGRRVQLMGYVEDVWSWMKRADVFVSVSHFEGHPNTVIEAAASGCPLVLSDIPGHRTMLNDADALFVDRTSALAIADAIERVLKEPLKAIVRADAARASVADLSIAAMARQYNDVYREIRNCRLAKGAR